MDKIKLQTCYLPVDVKDRLPKDNQSKYYAESNGDIVVGDFSKGNFDWENITGWLEKQEVIILTKEELEEIAQQIFNEGQRKRSGGNANFKKYFEGIFKQ